MPSKTKTKKVVNQVKAKVKKMVIPKSVISGTDTDFNSKCLSMLMEGKKSAKAEITPATPDGKAPLMLIFATDLNGEKELIKRDVLFKLLEGLRVLNLRAVVIDTQQQSDINNLSELSSMMQNHIIWYNPKTDNSGRAREEKEIDRLLLAADTALLFQGHLELIRLLMNYGVVIVGEEKSPLLENYKANEESGNAFLFTKKDHWGIFAAVVRALETFKFPYDWKHIVRKIYR